MIDHKTKRTVEETLGLSGVLTFTVREGQPLHLTREQVATLSVDDFLQLWQVSLCHLSMYSALFEHLRSVG